MATPYDGLSDDEVLRRVMAESEKAAVATATAAPQPPRPPVYPGHTPDGGPGGHGAGGQYAGLSDDEVLQRVMAESERTAVSDRDQAAAAAAAMPPPQTPGRGLSEEELIARVMAESAAAHKAHMRAMQIEEREQMMRAIAVSEMTGPYAGTGVEGHDSPPAAGADASTGMRRGRDERRHRHGLDGGGGDPASAAAGGAPHLRRGVSARRADGARTPKTAEQRAHAVAEGRRAFDADRRTKMARAAQEANARVTADKLARARNKERAVLQRFERDAANALRAQEIEQEEAGALACANADAERSERRRADARRVEAHETEVRQKARAQNQPQVYTATEPTATMLDSGPSGAESDSESSTVSSGVSRGAPQPPKTLDLLVDPIQQDPSEPMDASKTTVAHNPHPVARGAAAREPPQQAAVPLRSRTATLSRELPRATTATTVVRGSESAAHDEIATVPGVARSCSLEPRTHQPAASSLVDVRSTHRPGDGAAPLSGDPHGRLVGGVWAEHPSITGPEHDHHLQRPPRLGGSVYTSGRDDTSGGSRVVDVPNQPPARRLAFDALTRNQLISAKVANAKAEDIGGVRSDTADKGRLAVDQARTENRLYADQHTPAALSARGLREP
jgi:hypothetical protein